MKYTIIISPTFENDLDNIINFYIDKNSNYAEKIFKEVKELIISLNDFPEKYAKISDDIPNKDLNIRQFVYDNYRIIYQIKENYIYILTILGQNLLNFDKLNND